MIKIITGITLAVTAFTATAEPPKYLNNQLVKTENGSMIYRSYHTCDHNLTKMKQQIAVSSTAPKDSFISHDHFLFLSANMESEFMQKMTKEGGMYSNCDVKESVIGTPNTELKVNAYKEGIQVQMLDNGEVIVSTAHDWEELHK